MFQLLNCSFSNLAQLTRQIIPISTVGDAVREGLVAIISVLHDRMVFGVSTCQHAEHGVVGRRRVFAAVVMFTRIKKSNHLHNNCREFKFVVTSNTHIVLSYG